MPGSVEFIGLLALLAAILVALVWLILSTRRGGVAGSPPRPSVAAPDTGPVPDTEELRHVAEALERREQLLQERERAVVVSRGELDQQRTLLDQQRGELESARADLEGQQAAWLAELERIGELTAEQARAEVLAAAERDARRDALVLARDIEATAAREAEQTARMTIATAIQRLAAEQTSESVISTVDLPNDEMKGRIIGREGRNVRAFEQLTGVNVVVDDTPGTVLLSCFDPVRREIARLTLEELIADGRIHPARIEDVHARSQERIAERCQRAAEEAVAQVGITDLDPELMRVLGTLQYRTSYGQNVLKHLVESAHLARLMATELGIDPTLSSRAAFLHDIGKALTHEVEGSHAMVGAELARKHGEHPDVVHAIAAHHNEVEPATVEAVLVQAADAMSGSRPGARREALEAYVHRLDRLEQIALDHPGVEKVFAMQAGREVRVMVAPETVDDLASQAMARDIARRIESELSYPGQIRVTVVRESRATEVAR